MWQILRFYQPPMLVIEYPGEAERVTSPVEIQGRTDPQATITINSIPIITSTDGTFNSIV